MLRLDNAALRGAELFICTVCCSAVALSCIYAFSADIAPSLCSLGLLRFCSSQSELIIELRLVTHLLFYRLVAGNHAKVRLIVYDHVEVVGARRRDDVRLGENSTNWDRAFDRFHVQAG